MKPRMLCLLSLLLLAIPCQADTSSHFKEIQAKLALPAAPKFIADVQVPSGTRLYEGLAAPNFGSPGGGWQSYINEGDELPDSWFVNRRVIP